MGSSEVRRVGSIWPPSSSSQQWQSKIAPSIRERRFESVDSSQMVAKRMNSSEFLAKSFAVRGGLENNPINLDDPRDNVNMGTKRKYSCEERANSFAVGVGQQNKLFKLEDLEDNEHAIVMSAHLQMMEKFIGFCSEKKVKFFQDQRNTTSLNFDEEKNTFQAKVIDELCRLVEESSYGKCHYCSLPAESLVLSVLQILLNASQTFGNKANSPQAASQKHSNNEPDIFPCTNATILKTDSVYKNSIIQKGLQSIVAPLMPMVSKSKPNSFVGKLRQATTSSVPGPLGSHTKVVSPEVYIMKETKPKGTCSDLGKLADQIYNNKNLDTLVKKNITNAGEDHNRQHQMEPSRRFQVCESETRYYKVLCDLAHSDRSCQEAVMLYKTTVTFSSLGESVQPLGHVDNFFMSGYCRKLFDDSHPKVSKKHYFYPRIGGCLMAYKSEYDVTTVKNSFVGANLALKLHLADKLCFPVHHSKHWFVFIVDLRVNSFVFLDSLYDENDVFQIHARDRLIPAFIECFYQYAEVKLNLEDFEVLYPPVPKQSNINDCGIFAVMFMELWDNNIDLRNVFNHCDIPNLRVKIGNWLYFSKNNAVDKTLVQKCFDQGLDPHFGN